MLAARQIMQALVLVGGGVLSDRLPRAHVLVGASLIQATAQAVTAALILSGDATVVLVGLQGLYGLGVGLVVPAEVGLVPQTVSPGRLQQANALQGLSRNLPVGILGPALGGALVVAGSPGIALAADAGRSPPAPRCSAAIRVPLREGEEQSELRARGSRGLAGVQLADLAVVDGAPVRGRQPRLRPRVGPCSGRDLRGGSRRGRRWATILSSAASARCRRPPSRCESARRRRSWRLILAATPLVLPMVLLGARASVWLLCIASFFVGAGIAVHLTLWFTVFQREVPEHAQSRVSSYDALGSFVLVPLGCVRPVPPRSAPATLVGGRRSRRVLA